MRNARFLPMVAAILSIAICKSVWAVATCGANEEHCWSCGSDCAARYDATANTLTFSGTRTEEIYGNYGYQSPWLNEINGKLSKVIFEDGMETINACFSGYKGLSADEIYIPNTVKEIGGGIFYRFTTSNLVIPESVDLITGNIFYDSGVQRVVIPEDTIIKYPWSGEVELTYWPSGEVYCTASKCGDNATVYEKDGDNYVVYNKDGSIRKVFGSWSDLAGNKDVISGSYVQKDENGNPKAQYDGNGNVLKSWMYGADGSVAVYDKNGNLRGMKKRGAFTQSEAAAATHDGNDNVVSITW